MRRPPFIFALAVPAHRSAEIGLKGAGQGCVAQSFQKSELVVDRRSTTGRSRDPPLEFVEDRLTE